MYCRRTIRGSGTTEDLEALRRKKAEALSKPPPSATRPPLQLLGSRKLTGTPAGHYSFRRAPVTPRQALRFIAQHGVVLEAARGPVPSLLEAALGGRPRGSWRGHPRGKEFFWLTRAVRASRDVLVCRLVSGKVTYFHRRLWPALAPLERRFGRAALQTVHEVHTASGAHRITLTPFRKRVSRRVLASSARLSPDRALAALGSWTGGLTPH